MSSGDTRTSRHSGRALSRSSAFMVRVMSTVRNISLNIGENVRLFAGHSGTSRPKFLKGIAAALYYFALFLRELRADDIALQAVFSTGEILTNISGTPSRRPSTARSHDPYGHMERTVAVSECPQGAAHPSGYGILELVSKVPMGPASRAENGFFRLGSSGTRYTISASPLATTWKTLWKSRSPSLPVHADAACLDCIASWTAKRTS